jgi:hypothetical protein
LVQSIHEKEHNGCIYIYALIVMMNVCVCICTHVLFEQMMRCMCMSYSQSNRNVTHHHRPSCREKKREGNKCVVREDDDDIPRLYVSLAVFLFSLILSRLPVKKVFMLPYREFILFSLPMCAVNQSFRLYIHMRLSSFNVLFNVLTQA